MTARRGYAVVGYAVRFPGAANADEFWDLLADGRHSVSEIPADRWDVEEYFDANPDAAGKMVTRRAGFIDDIAGFDASFFGVSPREANFMDPQHRLILETTWSAIEHAGIAPSALAGTRTGVYVGLSTHEFLGMLIRFNEAEDIDIYSGTGTSPAAAAGRISFRLGLQGPAVAVDTACSSSLVAVHQACQAIDAGDCDIALVGGVNVILTPVPMINFSRARMLAPDGKCKTFDAAADGYVRGEGCGVVVVKRLEDALRDGDRIRAVIRGSAVNQDGASGGLTVPNGGAQQRVIADALERAGLKANEVDYLEAHGTGTSLGDPIEIQAAGAVFGTEREPDTPLLVGSVKTNIGHLEAASGIAGLIKVVLSLEKEMLPKHLHFRTPSPHIPWDRLPVRIVGESTPWQRGDRPRVAGVSSFGFSGTNAHVLVEESPAEEAPDDGSAEPDRDKYQILPLSASSPEALTELALRYQTWLEANPDASLADICATAGAGRSHFQHRAALVVDSQRRTRRLLRAMQEDRPAPGLVLGRCADRPKTAWLFPGQGSRYPEIFRELRGTEAVFRDTVTRCADALDGVLAQPLLDVLDGSGAEGATALGGTAFAASAQPALFAVEMGLARLWQSWGISPDVVLGHGVGQYAAACVAGVFSIEDGARLVGERARLFSRLPAGGGMAAVHADARRVEECLSEFPDLSVASYDGASTVLSGPSDDLEKALAPLIGIGIRCERLDTSHAFQSALVDPALDEFESFAGRFEFAPPQVAVVCSRTGAVLTRQTRLDAQYWRRHARQPVRFADGVRTLADLGCAVLMELGPQAGMIAAAMRIWPDTTTAPVPIASLRPDADAHRCFTEALAVAYSVGHRLDFAAHRLRRDKQVDLPTYPFQHRPYWFPKSQAAAETDALRTAIAPPEVVAAAPGQLPVVEPVGVLVLSGPSAEALGAVAARYAAWLADHPDVDIADLCYAAGTGRTHFEHRAALVVTSLDAAHELLTGIANGQLGPGAVRGICAGPPKTAWLFTGQGSQYPGMARELFDTEPVFADTVTRCARANDEILARPLLEVLFPTNTDSGGGSEDALRDTTYAQPALFAIEMGLARLWQSWGIEPDVVLGHSVGQYAAACVAGVFSLEDGAQLIAHRARLFGSLPEGGRMVAVFADAENVKHLAEGYPQVSVAAYNGANTVLSGSATDLQDVVTACTHDGIRATWLDTSHAFHSTLLDPVLDEFESYATQLDYATPTRALICNRTGKPLTAATPINAAYWRQHARQPVQFAESVRTLADTGVSVLMEIGPQPILTATALHIWPQSATPPHTIASLRKNPDHRHQIAQALARTYITGHQPHFAAQHHQPRHKLELPTYPFQYPPSSLSDSESGHELAEPQLVQVAQTDWFTGVPPEDRLDRVSELLRAELGAALGMAATDIEPHAEFVSLGMDSLIAMELRRRIQTAFGTAVPASLFFTHPTVPTLAEGLLDLWLVNSSDPGKGQLPIPRLERQGELPLSHAQEQLWFLNELLPSSSAYNVAIRIDIPGELDRDVLRRSLDALVARHEVLRTTFHSALGVPQARLVEAEPFKVPFEKLGTDADVDAAALREANVTFDIGVGPLLRARLFGLDSGLHVLVLTMHHIVTDGWSFRVLLRDLGTIYQALDKGEPVALDELPIQYADYAQWQTERLRGPDFDTLLDYWKEDLAGAPALELDTDRPRPKTPTFQGARIRFELGQHRAAAMRELCRAENVMLSVPLLAAFAAVLQRYSGQDDMVIGTLTANRDRAETEQLIGFFANALPVRVRLDGNPTVVEFLHRIKQRIIEVLAHQDVPFDLIVNATSPDREANRNPIFSVQLVVQPGQDSDGLSGLDVKVAEVDTQTAKRDLTLTFSDDEQLSAHAEYASELFDTVRIERLIDHYRLVVDAILQNPGQLLTDLPLLTESEAAYYRTTPAPRTTTAGSIPELFELTVDRAPDAPAVTTDTGTLTYRQLDDAANRLARRLKNLRIEPGTAVGLRVGRTAAMPIGMLGILKAGCAYVPIDPSYPEDRIEHMLGDAGVMLLLDDEAVAAAADEPVAQRLETAIAPDDLAYVMYTSGSTGRPKGVAISHRSVVEYAETLGREVGVTADDVYLVTASISFSSSIRQLLVPFAVGAEVVIANTEERRDPIAMLRRICESGVTVADLVPTVVRRVVDAVADAPPHQEIELRRNRLRLLLTASEPLRAGVVRAWRARMGDDITWINMYGQTETTGIVSLNKIGALPGNDQAIVPIGRPRGNMGMHVLDPNMRPVPPGIAGEMYISGPGLAREYLGALELTAQKFVPAPWDRDERLYVSGDVVRLGWDGTIEFRSRADRQVKIRGLRVEPAEIDRVLLEHPGVREVATVAKELDGGESVLVSYFAPQDAHVSVSELRSHARLQLPEHMVPIAFHALDSLPQTPNGKLDRNALPEVTVTRDQDVEFVAPRAGVEESLATIWRNTLQIAEIGAGDNFFELGGHSLLAAQVRSRIHQLLGVELPLEALFEDQTLSELARRVENTPNANEASEAPPLVPAPRAEMMPLSYAQELMWQLERDEPGSSAHWIDVSIQITGPLDATMLVQGVHDAVARHELLRTVFRTTESSVSQVILGSYLPDVPVQLAGDDTDPSLQQQNPESQWRDLDTRPPFRAELTRIADDNHILRVRAHRILADGYTMRLLLGEIGGLVASSAGFTEFPLLDGDLTYVDFAAWERSWLTGDALARRVDYFRQRFANGIPAAIPTDHPRSARPDRHGRQYAFEFPRAVADAARALAIREQASLYSVLLTAFAVAVGDYADTNSLVISAPVTRRNDAATELIMGPFMNTVPLRINLTAGADLPTLVREVKTEVMGALAHQDAPWQHILTALAAEHGSAALGIGEVTFLMDDPAPGEFAAGGFTLTRIAPTMIIARRELTASMSSKGGNITGTLTYNGELFDAPTIEHIVSTFIATLTGPHVDMP